VEDALVNVGASHESLQPLCAEAQQHLANKLWHPMTEVMAAIAVSPALSGWSNAQAVWGWILPHVHLLNQMTVAAIGIALSQRAESQDTALQHLKEVREKVSQHAPAHALVGIEQAAVILKQGKVGDASEMAEEVEKQMESFSESVVVSRFHAVVASIAQEKADFEGFYRNTLLHLAARVTEGADFFSVVPQAEAEQIAHKLAVAAVAGETIYQFGELMEHPVMKALSGGSHHWLVELLRSYCDGIPSLFEDVVKAHGSQLQAEIGSKVTLGELRSKNQLFCLLELSRRRTASGRTLSLEEVTSATGCSRDKVEGLVMLAVCKGLLKASIDGVDEVVVVSWVQPRVLSKANVEIIADNVSKWLDKVSATNSKLSSEATDLA